MGMNEMCFNRERCRQDGPWAFGILGIILANAWLQHPLKQMLFPPAVENASRRGSKELEANMEA